MCGRFTFFIKNDNKNELLNAFHSDEPNFELKPNYNVAPTQTMPVVVRNSPNHFELMKWGLIPFWAKDKKIGFNLINARANTLAEKPSFRNALKSRRCIVPSTGFYEWNIKDGSKQPYFIYPTKTDYFAFAGLYETWTDKSTGEEIRSYTIVTTDPNDKMSKLHDRMPVILSDDGMDKWLDKKYEKWEDLMPLLLPCPDEWIDMYEVSKEVNSVKNNYKDLLNKN